MISDFFLDVWHNLASFFLGLFPADWALPSWLSDFGGAVSGIVANAYNMGAWVPWAVFFTIAGSLLALWAVLAIVKGVRWVLNWLPTWGGN